MDATERFSSRVAEYVRYRPEYPAAVFEQITARVPPELPRRAADMGSGTGIFSRALLARGWQVHAVEPNAEMRGAAERALRSESGFVSHAGRAEASGLPARAVALVVAAQAFHWFDAAACRREWRRILLERGLVCLIWNRRRLGSSFMNGYEAALTNGAPEYGEVVRRQHDEAAIFELFAGDGFEKVECSNEQLFDWDGFSGRVLSSSYAPRSGEAGHQALMGELRRLYEAHERGGLVRFDYVTTLYMGGLSAEPRSRTDELSGHAPE